MGLAYLPVTAANKVVRMCRIRLWDNSVTNRQTNTPTVVTKNPIRPIVAKNLVAWSQPEESQWSSNYHGLNIHSIYNVKFLI